MDYLKDQLITYLGNKRSLLSNIEECVVDIIKEELYTNIISVDLFSGSGVVARMLSNHSNKVITNDLELYNKVINECFLYNKKDVSIKELHKVFNKLVIDIELKKKASWISEHYSPKDDTNIKEGERVFYTNYNALYLDTARELIHKLEEPFKTLLLGPLLSEASKHCNTSGVFKGFYKNKQGIGQFGGEGKNAISRITGTITVQIPILSNNNIEFECHQRNANNLIKELERANIVYMDPPYNQHPYASNYFMLNAIASNKEPQQKSKVSGIPKEWNSSIYNKKKEAREALADCVYNTKADYIIISYNNEGFVSKDEFIEDLEKLGSLTIKEIDYNTFKASRNLSSRTKKVTEYLFILKK